MSLQNNYTLKYSAAVALMRLTKYTEKRKKRIFTLNIICIKDVYIVCVNEYVFEMINIHILIHCDTYHCKQTMCVPRVSSTSDRRNASEIQAVCNNRNN